MSDTTDLRAHLTAEQIGELLDSDRPGGGPTNSRAQAHVETCAECAAELESLRETLALFRESASEYARQQLAGRALRPFMASSPRTAASPQLVWAAAALVAIGFALPLRHHARPAPVAATTHAVTANARATGESNQALMDDIDRDLSASVPASLQPLALTAGSSQAAIQTTTIRKN